MVSPVSGWAVVVGALEAEGTERVEQAVRVLEVHVVPGGAGLAVAALKEQYFLGDSGGEARGEQARRNGVDPNPERAEVTSHRQRHAGDAGLGGAIGAAIGHRVDADR